MDSENCQQNSKCTYLTSRQTKGARSLHLALCESLCFCVLFPCAARFLGLKRRFCGNCSVEERGLVAAYVREYKTAVARTWLGFCISGVKSSLMVICSKVCALPQLWGSRGAPSNSSGCACSEILARAFGFAASCAFIWGCCRPSIFHEACAFSSATFRKIG